MIQCAGRWLEGVGSVTPGGNFYTGWQAGDFQANSLLRSERRKTKDTSNPLEKGVVEGAYPTMAFGRLVSSGPKNNYGGAMCCQ